MSTLMISLIGISLVGLLAISVYRFIAYRNLRSFIFQLLALGIIAALLYKFFYVSAIPKADDSDISLVIRAYAVMIFGMLSKHLYSYCAKPEEERPPFDFGLFVAPIFLSPIIFLPLVLAFQDAQVLTNKSQVGIFIVAFQNGFFWKEYFDNLQKQKKQSGENAETGNQIFRN